MREKLVATAGHVLTNGEIYGTEIYPGDGMTADAFYEITDEEYAALSATSDEEDAS